MSWSLDSSLNRLWTGYGAKTGLSHDKRIFNSNIKIMTHAIKIFPIIGAWFFFIFFFLLISPIARLLSCLLCYNSFSFILFFGYTRAWGICLVYVRIQAPIKWQLLSIEWTDSLCLFKWDFLINVDLQSEHENAKSSFPA